MKAFETAFNHTVNHEGGYSNHPQDRGGETYKGITRKFYGDWDGWKLIDLLIKDEYKTSRINDVLNGDNDLQRRVKEFYLDKFWKPLKLDELNDLSVQVELFDTAVNMGVGTAGKFLQRALNLLNRNGKDYRDILVDGSIGPNTIKAFNACKRKENLFKMLNALQGARYIDIAEDDKTQEVFMHGWFNRVDFKRL